MKEGKKKCPWSKTRPFAWADRTLNRIKNCNHRQSSWLGLLESHNIEHLVYGPSFFLCQLNCGGTPSKIQCQTWSGIEEAEAASNKYVCGESRAYSAWLCYGPKAPNPLNTEDILQETTSTADQHICRISIIDLFFFFSNRCHHACPKVLQALSTYIRKDREWFYPSTCLCGQQ